jgi:DNA-binding MarR family transcriptional regulator
MAARTRDSASVEAGAQAGMRAAGTRSQADAGTETCGAAGDGAAAGATAATGAAGSIGTAVEDGELLRRWFQVYAGMQNLTADLLAEVERTVGLTAPEFQVLWHLGGAAERRAPMNEVSRLLGFSTAGTTKLIDRLCATGLVERRTSPSDRRVILAELTDPGAAASGRAAQILADALRERFVARLGEDRVAAVVEAFALLSPDSGGSGTC